VTDQENTYSSIYTAIVFHLEGSPPKGFIISERAAYTPNDERMPNSKNRVFLSCRLLLDVCWHPIKFANDYEYLIDLSHKEYFDILNTKPPEDILKLAR